MMLRCFFSQPAFSAPSWRLGEAGRQEARDTSPITMLLDLAENTYTHNRTLALAFKHLFLNNHTRNHFKAFVLKCVCIQTEEWKVSQVSWLISCVFSLSGSCLFIISLIEACIVPHSVCWMHKLTHWYTGPVDERRRATAERLQAQIIAESR